MKRTALLSVYDKTGIVEFAQVLVDLDWTIYSSGGTAKVLADAGLPVTDVSELVGGGAILDHRVVTRDAQIATQGYWRDRSTKQSARAGNAAASPSSTWSAAICIRSRKRIAQARCYHRVCHRKDRHRWCRTMLRSAAKGRRIVIADPVRRQEVVEWLKAGEPEPEAFRNELAAVAEGVIAGYCLALSTLPLQGHLRRHGGDPGADM